MGMEKIKLRVELLRKISRALKKTEIVGADPADLFKKVLNSRKKYKLWRASQKDH